MNRIFDSKYYRDTVIKVGLINHNLPYIVSHPPPFTLTPTHHSHITPICEIESNMSLSVASNGGSSRVVWLDILTEYVVCIVHYLQESVIPTIGYVCKKSSVYFIDEYKFVTILSLLLIILMILTLSYIKYPSRQGSRVRRVNASGFAIMSCSKCDNVAIYGKFRGDKAVSCPEHKKSGNVKVFGCLIDSCKKRCYKKSYCRGHQEHAK